MGRLGEIFLKRFSDDLAYNEAYAVRYADKKKDEAPFHEAEFILPTRPVVIGLIYVAIQLPQYESGSKDDEANQKASQKILEVVHNKLPFALP